MRLRYHRRLILGQIFTKVSWGWDKHLSRMQKGCPKHSADFHSITKDSSSQVTVLNGGWFLMTAVLSSNYSSWSKAKHHHRIVSLVNRESYKNPTGLMREMKVKQKNEQADIESLSQCDQDTRNSTAFPSRYTCLFAVV